MHHQLLALSHYCSCYFTLASYAGGEEVIRREHLLEHLTLASSEWAQLWTVSALAGQSMRRSS